MYLCYALRCARRSKLPVSFSRRIYRKTPETASTPLIQKFTIPFESSGEIQEELGVDTEEPVARNEARSGINRGARTVKNSLPPSLQYVRDTMDKHKDYVVITQMGSFYEFYFEHAEIYAPKLNLTLTSRDYVYGKVAFAGFPVHQIERHLKVLVKELGYSVAIADQFKKDVVVTNETNKFLRRVTRIVTPGTFIDEAFENLQENTYLLSLEFPENCMLKAADIDTKVGLCWCDISTGEIFVQQVLLKDVVSAVARINPREILLDEELLQYSLESGQWYSEFVELKKFFIKYQRLPSGHREIRSFYSLFNVGGETEHSLLELDMTLRDFTQKEVAALRNTLLYIEEHLPNTTVNLQAPQRQLASSIMQIDPRTSSLLELNTTLRTNTKKGSLLSVIRRTVTPSGSRLLSQWLSAPSLDIIEIQQRQKLVKLFQDNFDLTEVLIRTLKQTYDMPRILQKFSFGKGDATELLQMSHSMQRAELIGDFIQKEFTANKGGLNKLLKSFINLLKCDETLVTRVFKSLDEEQLAKFSRAQAEQENPNAIASEGDQDRVLDPLGESGPWVVRPQANGKLQALHEARANCFKDRRHLHEELKSFFVGEIQARSVQLKTKQTSEYAVHISATSSTIAEILKRVKGGLLFQGDSFRVIQKSAQSCWLSLRPWTDLGQELEYTVMKIRKEENAFINELKKDFVQRSTSIRNVAHILDYLDVLTSFAKLSLEKNLVNPLVNTTANLDIKGGRHIVVEDGLITRSLEQFTPNSCNINAGNLWVITGPNMGGKSTFLRQNAIIVILAQIGCPVPCEAATIGLVDKIFSRVGSADDLYNEMSTFMVEMIETSYILKGATSKSLAILDEIGRGTSGKEGVSIAYATLKHLIEKNSCRSLFATHFGKELQMLINSHCSPCLQQNVSYYQSAVYDVDDSFCYDHKLTPGVCAKSDAIRVALKAGFPKDALKNAEEVLKIYN
ncbi:LANO_0E12640g1_1 [Lachancea nothofagi CBS 11611]|uniref:LANO_0E12640g1_1 n=1 Tax=Lachancea nothofagi CBS 11611 TaxID=1266666 RepID=A0A1G4JYH3_9SACH|nr:LANO_0E12640g1_1 [Lachancea nothofagi CBS 11611]